MKNKKFDNNNNNPGLYINIIKHNNIIEEEEETTTTFITYDNPKSMNPKELDDNLSCNDVLNNHS